MRSRMKFAAGALAVASLILVAPGATLAKAPCKDASGKFVTCPATPAKPATAAAPAKATSAPAAKPAKTASTGTAAPASATAPAAKGAPQCKTGKPCGNSCIAKDKVCHQ